MKKYKLALIPLFSVMALLGCGDDSSSDPVSTSKGFPEDGSSVESIYDLGSCTSDREGDKFAANGYQTQEFNENEELETVDDLDDSFDEDDFSDDEI